MYEMSTDLYTCDFCGVQMKWNESKEGYGTMYGCEKCGREFCSRCFKKYLGNEKFVDMLADEEKVLCPSCYAEKKLPASEYPLYVDGELNDVMIAKTIRRAADLFDDGAILEAEELLCAVDNALREYIHEN